MHQTIHDQNSILKKNRDKSARLPLVTTPAFASLMDLFLMSRRLASGATYLWVGDVSWRELYPLPPDPIPPVTDKQIFNAIVGRGLVELASLR